MRTHSAYATRLHNPLLLFSWFEDLKAAHQRVVHAHHGTRVVKLSAVIRSAKNRHELTPSKEFIAVFDDLMRPTDQVKVVATQELGHYVFTKGKGDTTVVFSPAYDVFVRVGPQQIAQQASVRDVRGTHDALDLFHILQLWAKPAVHAEDLFVYDGRNWQAVEAVSEGLPQLNIVPPLALVVESIYSVNRCALMIASQNEKVLRILNFICK